MEDTLAGFLRTENSHKERSLIFPFESLKIFKQQKDNHLYSFFFIQELKIQLLRPYKLFLLDELRLLQPSNPNLTRLLYMKI